MSLRLNHSVDRLKPDKRAKENRFGGVQPPDPSKKGAARAEKTEPMMMMTSLFPFSSAFHSERDCHFFDMRPPMARAFNNMLFACYRKKNSAAVQHP